MRVLVKDGEHNIHIVLPTRLLFSNLTARIGAGVLRRYVPDACAELPPDKIKVLFAEVRRIKNKYGRWELVDVVSADGEIVKVIL